ncbi:acyl-homoserine-lactone synthase [Paraburkholderia sp.]|uniref:acyl-homoserine-lactone synthase n=1 Tax=Paraburkholderia sp. TaxID=1926495 RepID=UPI002D50E88C|nr:acyl-homoserine-lactone synthase [Paraburkholderia sp.]HZZ04478.1 acyl-homoserine-lactone synthase [Paraburkholderia sp.]
METIVVSIMGNLSPAARQQLGRYRYAVFVEQMKWDLPAVNPRIREEWDEFDREDTVNVIAYAADRSICGYARLLRTTQPYLLSEVFAGLCSVPLICDSSTWELSRFTTSHAGAELNAQRMRRLLREVFLQAEHFGFQQLIGVAPCGMERLYRRLGLVLRALGPVRTGGDGLAAFSLDIDAVGLRALSD